PSADTVTFTTPLSPSACRYTNGYPFRLEPEENVTLPWPGDLPSWETNSRVASADVIVSVAGCLKLPGAVIAEPNSRSRPSCGTFPKLSCAWLTVRLNCPLL